jgi:hypothetical protein
MDSGRIHGKRDNPCCGRSATREEMASEIRGDLSPITSELVTHGKRGKRCVMDAYFLSELPTQFSTLSLFFNVFEIATSQTAAWYHELFEIMGR